MNKTYLSINTDDFGLSNSINRGVLDSFVYGILTDASIMPNGTAFNEAVEIALRKKIPIAAHINLIRGKMITNFPIEGSVLQLWRKSLNKKFLKKVEQEVRSQIEKIKKTGIKINQLNSEKHIHFFPHLFKLWIKLAIEYNIPYIRFIREFNIIPGIQGIKANILSFFSLKNKRYLDESPIRATDNFTGLTYTGILNEIKLKKIILNLKPGWTELMVHVGYRGEIDATMGDYFLKNSREEELNSLINPEIKSIIKASNVILKDFGGNYGK